MKMTHNAYTDRPTILVVDDSPDNLTLISELLNSDYVIKAANTGKVALKIAESESPPDLILLDIMMPELNGYDVCRQLKSDSRTMGIPVIFLTAKMDEGDETMGLEAGAVDYITKPISPPILIARVKTHLALKVSADFLKDKNDFLEAEVTKRTRDLSAIQDVTILVLTSLAETRDTDTGNHIRRTQLYVRLLAENLNTNPRFSAQLTPTNIDMLYKSAPLHDIGKVGIPDRILLKPGKLTTEEFEIMKTHSALGKAALDRAEFLLGYSVPFLLCAKSIALSHHEKWDGTGYPEGLVGDQIAIEARLMALADVYDALTSKRIYKDALTHSKAFNIIVAGSATHFDPDLVNTFIKIQDQFISIAQKYADNPQSATL